MIEVKNVSKTFFKGTRKEQTVLENASLSLPSTGLVCLVGPSGSGKSTILNAIGGLISYDGKILYDGNEVKIEEYRRNHIGYIFQDFLLFDSLSVRDNIKIGLALADVYEEKEVSRRTEILLKAVGLNINSSRSAGALSLGQKQRVGIARALANSPKILLADEPTGNLDSKNSLRIMDILKSLSKERLVIVVTHNMSLVNLYADQAFRIENRAFVEFDPKEEDISEVYEEETKKQSYQKRETKVGSLTLSFYAEDDAPERKITIVERNGKLIVTGENVTLSSEDALKPILEQAEKSEEKKEEGTLLSTEEKTERGELSSEEETSSEDSSLTFEPRHDKKPLKERSFFLSLFNRNPLGQTQYKGKKSFRILEIILPLLAFLFFNLYFVSVDITAEAITVYNMENNLLLAHYTDEKKKEVSEDPDNKQVSLTIDDYIQWKKDDPHLISGPKTSPVFVTRTWGATYAESHNSLPYFELTFEDGSSFLSTSDQSRFLLLEEYKPIFPAQLNSYTLADDEVLVDISLSDNDNYHEGEASGTTITFFRSNGSSNNGEQASLTPYKQDITYKVKGFVNTGLNAIFGPNALKEYFELMTFGHAPYSNEYNLTNYFTSFPSLEGTTFLRQGESDSSFTYSEEGSPSAIDPKYFTKSEQEEPRLFDYLPYVTLSEEEKKNWLLQKTYYYDDTGDYSIYVNPAFVTNADSVRDPKNANAKIMAFKKTNIGEQEYDSYREFYRLLVATKLITSVRIDPTCEDDDESGKIILHLPSGLSDSFPDVSLLPDTTEVSYVFDNRQTLATNDNLTYMKNMKVGTSYQGSIDDPIHLSEKSYQLLLYHLTQQGPTFLPLYYKDSLSQSSLQSAYNSGSFLLTSDPESTISYLNNRYKEEGVVFETVASVRRQIGENHLQSDSAGYLIVLLVLFLLFIVFALLDNIGKVNSLRYNIGVKRCLGYSKGAILEECIADLLVNFLTETVIPTLIFSVLLYYVNLYSAGGFLLVFFFIYLLVTMLAMLIPLLILLGKKPADILHSLN